MSANPYIQRVDEEIYSADPLTLISLLSRALCERIAAARAALRAGRIHGRSTEISRAVAIVGELAQSLAPEANPELADRLGHLYSFLVERLLIANSQQLDAPLEDALRIAGVLAEAWSGIESLEPAGHFTECGSAEKWQGRLSYSG